MQTPAFLNKLAKVALGLGAAASAIQTSLFDGTLIALRMLIVVVDGGQRAVIFNRFKGVESRVVGEGTHFRFHFHPLGGTSPRTESHGFKPPSYSTFGLGLGPSRQPRAPKVAALPLVLNRRDLQVVNITLRVLSRPEIDKLPLIYNTLGVDFDERILPSIVNEVLKSVVVCRKLVEGLTMQAQYNAEQLLTMREKVSRQIKEILLNRATDFNIILEDISIVSRGPAFSHPADSPHLRQGVLQRD